TTRWSASGTRGSRGCELAQAIMMAPRSAGAPGRWGRRATPLRARPPTCGGRKARRAKCRGRAQSSQNGVSPASGALIVGVLPRPPARCDEPDLVAHVRVAEPGGEPGTCSGQPQQQQRRFYFLLLRRGGALIGLPARAVLGKIARDDGREGSGS